MKIDAPNLNHLWAQLMIEELIRNGVTHFFVAPGSRSSPLALAVAERAHGVTAARRQKKTDGGPPSLHVHFDERGLAFAALGCARATGIPVAVITTSGTAVANLFPAVIEASMDHVPMILLTGDRPPELRDCGANQAIDQLKIFGDYVRWFFDVPCPDEKISPRFVLTTIDQAVARAATGPVHLNCQFREPLAPSSLKYDRKAAEADLSRWLQSDKPQTRHSSPVQMTTNGELIEEILPRKKVFGVILAAGLRNEEETRAVHKLSIESGWPIFADARSGLRFGLKGGVSAYADLMFLSEKCASQFTPEVVLQFGTRPISKRIQDWLTRNRPPIHAVIAPGADRLDAGLTVTHRWVADVEWAARCLLPRLKKSATVKWKQFMGMHDLIIEKIMSNNLRGCPLNEPWILHLLSFFLPKGHLLVAANSMPIRDADMFGSRYGQGSGVIANRGASGIDGTVATAAGVALGSDKGVTLAIGDLAFLHDLNSLALVRQATKPFVIVAINNDGGGIFSFLPVAQYRQHFEKVFGTPHGLGFENAAKMFGIEYVQPTNGAELNAAYLAACQRNGATLIEVRTNREENLRIHREIQDAVRKAVDRVVR